MENHEVIIRPVFSEAVYDLIMKDNKILFEVNKNANKFQIKRAVQELYNVKVVKVNTMITPQGVKKAIVKLAKEYPADDLAAELNLF
ncbi:MAG: 50S ribosomal protein L23 [Methanobacteriota archaeon]|nr:MAG: 50S ribosomal protein L23 [Euryarchaeota archaeon]